MSWWPRLRSMHELLVTEGSLVLVVVTLVIAGLGAPVSEDLTLLFAGVLAYNGVATLPTTVLICMAGVLVGDVLLFTTAQRLGRAAARGRFFQRVSESPCLKESRIKALFENHGGKVVFFARYVAGLRAPTFALAGVQGMSLKRFLTFDALALCISGPLMVTLGYLFSSQFEQLSLIHI